MSINLSNEVQTRIDTALAELVAGEQRWSVTTISERAELLRRTQAAVAEQAEAWAATACRIKQLPPGSPLAGEEWSAGPFATLWGLTALADTLGRIAQGHRPLDGVKLGATPGSRVAVPVLPRTLHDRVAYSGLRARCGCSPA